MRIVTTVQIDASLEKVWPLLDAGRHRDACDGQLFSWLSRVMILIGGPMMRRIVKRHMANLKRVAARRAGVPSFGPTMAHSLFRMLACTAIAV